MTTHDLYSSCDFSHRNEKMPSKDVELFPRSLILDYI